MSANKSKKALGENPLSKGIFTQTEQEKVKESAESKVDDISRKKNQESRIKNLENLHPSSEPLLNDSQKEKVNLRLPTELNDWLDDLIKAGKRRNGQKIPKEIWMQAALELLRASLDNPDEISSIEELREALERIIERRNS